MVFFLLDHFFFPAFQDPQHLCGQPSAQDTCRAPLSDAAAGLVALLSARRGPAGRQAAWAAVTSA